MTKSRHLSLIKFLSNGSCEKEDTIVRPIPSSIRSAIKVFRFSVVTIVNIGHMRRILIGDVCEG